MDSSDDPTLVPVEITINDRTGVTLWAPPWIEDGEEWQAFLGSGDRVMAFDSAADLARYLPRATDNDLSDHPVWEMYQTLPTAELEPDPDFRFDFDGALALVKKTSPKGPYDETVSVLGDLVDLAQRIAECTDDGPLISMLDTGTFTDLVEDADEDAPDWDEDDWQELVEVITRAWPLLTDRLSARIVWTDPDASSEPNTEDAGAPVASARRTPPESSSATAQPVARAAATTVGAAAAAGSAARAESEPPLSSAEFWDEIGIAPVHLTVAQGTGYTLRCFAEDSAIFLGSEMEIDVFRSTEGLVAWCQGPEAHDLIGFDTWPAVHDAPELPIEPLPEDTYDLTADSFKARELAGDIAGYCELAGVADTLDDDPDPADLSWNEVLAEITSCLRWHD